tara:strand:- start:780 stop:1571 length:792 start_codon:yes stop_codon:yes gene_type:complete
MTTSSNDFNAAADSYDEVFTYSLIGKVQRSRVYYWLKEYHFFKQSKNVFEVNCGTGYDAEQFHHFGHKVTATDGSDRMISIAKKNRAKSINFYQLAFQDIAGNNDLKNADFLFSNFGGLNCLDKNELANFITSVGALQKKQDQLAWVIMPKRCFMEDCYLFFKFKWNQIGRRNVVEKVAINVEGVAVDTFYHSPKEVSKLLENNYVIQAVKPVAFLLPPSYLEPFFKRYSWLLNGLSLLERLFGRFRIFANWSDHYLIIAERK